MERGGVGKGKRKKHRERGCRVWGGGGGGKTYRVCLFVCWLLYFPATYERDGSAQTVLRAATLR